MGDATTQHVLMLFDVLRVSRVVEIQRSCCEALDCLLRGVRRREASRTASAVGVQLRKHIGAETFVRMFDTVYKLTRHPILQQPAFELGMNLLQLSDDTFRLNHTTLLVEALLSIGWSNTETSAQALSSVNRLVAGIPPSLLANDTFYQNLNRVLFGLLETQDLRRLMAHEATRTPLLGTFLALGRIKRGFLDHPFFEQVVQGGARVQPLGQLFIALAAALHAEAERDDVDLNSIGLGGRALRYVRQFCRANAKDASVGVVLAYCAAFPALLKVKTAPDEHCQRVVRFCILRDHAAATASIDACSRWMRATAETSPDKLSSVFLFLLTRLRDVLVTPARRLSLFDATRFVNASVAFIDLFLQLRDTTPECAVDDTWHDEYQSKLRASMEGLALLFLCYETESVSDDALTLLNLLEKLHTMTASSKQNRKTLYGVFAGRPTDFAIRVARSQLREARDLSSLHADAVRYAWQQAFRVVRSEAPHVTPEKPTVMRKRTSTSHSRDNNVVSDDTHDTANNANDRDGFADGMDEELLPVQFNVWSAQWRFLMAMSSASDTRQQDFLSKCIDLVFDRDDDVRRMMFECVSLAPLVLLPKLVLAFEARLAQHDQAARESGAELAPPDVDDNATADSTVANDSDAAQHQQTSSTGSAQVDSLNTSGGLRLTADGGVVVDGGRVVLHNRRALLALIDVEFQHAIIGSLEHNTFNDASMTVVRRSMASVVQRWAQTPRAWLTALPVRSRERVAAVIELLCDPATQPAPSAVAEERLQAGGAEVFDDEDNPHMS
eukprot:CAMPEP_0168582840 /NCGR_PEP_ID=MMETSP0420-20121227/2208_1 /TAXON_ID=498008 /ORGANISM="Pessonella sp." /LENGTH=782 /DNA_ID=CAMNT_0008617377 /DNA_START=170 /DNA_END=2515 /DNA_ORIENTATION=+